MLNLNGQNFGRLTVLCRGKIVGNKRYWLCQCACGGVKQIRADSLRTNGGTRSCGCLQLAYVKSRGHHHGRGERFSRLVIIRQAGIIKKRGRVYLCLCDCGKKVKVQGRFLRAGLTTSCGCWYRATRTTTIKHGQCRITRKTGTYNAYQRKKSVCHNPNGRLAQYFHDKGIEFRFDSFQDFFREVGEKPHDDCWLVRIDPDGHFEAGNLTWRVVKRHRRKRKPK